MSTKNLKIKYGKQRTSKCSEKKQIFTNLTKNSKKRLDNFEDEVGLIRSGISLPIGGFTTGCGQTKKLGIEMIVRLLVLVLESCQLEDLKWLTRIYHLLTF